MREIRFRWQHQLTNEFVYWYLVMKEWEYWITIDWENWAPVWESTVGQYVWFRDKNWNKIYEWDIVQDDLWKIYVVEINEYGRVSLFNKNYDRINPFYGAYVFDWLYPENTLTITWNIHDDEDLAQKIWI